MKKIAAIALVLASGSSFAFFGDSQNGYSNGNGDMATNAAGRGNGAASGDFSMTINAKGTANFDGASDFAGNGRAYGNGYSQPYYYGYAPVAAPVAQ
jgi:hypothetical protein